MKSVHQNTKSHSRAVTISFPKQPFPRLNNKTLYESPLKHKNTQDTFRDENFNNNLLLFHLTLSVASPNSIYFLHLPIWKRILCSPLPCLWRRKSLMARACLFVIICFKFQTDRS